MTDPRPRPHPLPPDRIEIDTLAVRTVIGAFDDERDRRQEVRLHMSLDTDVRPAAASDSLDDAVDYKEVTKRVIALVEGSSFFLIETLAERVAEMLLEDRRVWRTTVRVEKPGALRHARSVAVTVIREREPGR